MANSTFKLALIAVISLYIIAVVSWFFVFHEIDLWASTGLFIDTLIVMIILLWALYSFQSHYHPGSGLLLAAVFGAIGLAFWNTPEIDYLYAFLLALAIDSIGMSIFIEVSGE